MRYAFINDNEVKKIEDVEEEVAFSQLAHYQQIILIDGLEPEPKVGWVWDIGKMYSNIKPVTPRQIRQALILSGVGLASIDAALGSLPEPIKSLAITEWEYSTLFERRRPLVQEIGSMLGWTSEQLDDLWIFAGTL